MWSISNLLKWLFIQDIWYKSHFNQAPIPFALLLSFGARNSKMHCYAELIAKNKFEPINLSSRTLLNGVAKPFITFKVWARKEQGALRSFDIKGY